MTPRPTARASPIPSRPSSKQLGGTVTGRQGVANPDGTADYTPILTQASGGNPEAVFFGGVSTTGGGKLRSQMADNEHG